MEKNTRSLDSSFNDSPLVFRKKIVRDYSNDNQFNQIDDYDSSTEQKKINFLENVCFNNPNLKGYISSYSFLNEFYILIAKDGNSLKANRVYVFIDKNNTCTIDFISEWTEKQPKKHVIRKIKKTIENVSTLDLSLIIKNAF